MTVFEHDGTSEPAGAGREVAARLLARNRRRAAVPLRRHVERCADEVISLLFPQLAEGGETSLDEIQARLDVACRDLSGLLGPLLPTERAREVTRRFAGMLLGIRDDLQADAQAIVDGDPAAASLDEVVVAYPGFLAVTIHRIAHGLHLLDVPLVPRLLAEVAHSRTGVDIHPAATIGRSFCIDHGTGVVIGETAVVGEGVKVYHGVTLGALSVSRAAAGSKRHPTVEDRVTLYANATVLGGDTVVGHDSVIGGNVWLATSVPPHSFVYHTSQVRVRRAEDALQALDYAI